MTNTNEHSNLLTNNTNERSQDNTNDNSNDNTNNNSNDNSNDNTNSENDNSISSILNSILNKTLINKNTSNTSHPDIASDEKFWILDPMIIIREGNLLTLWPKESMSRNEKLNTLSRLVIYLTLIGFIFTYSFKILISGIVTLGVFVFLYYSTIHNTEESFCNFNNINNFFTAPNIRDRFTLPEKKNPLMNVLQTEIMDNPHRNMAAPSFNPIITDEINQSTKDMIVNNFNNENVRNKLFGNLGDIFQFEQSMRNFHAMPNTTIPNDQGGFANFCFGSMRSCKEGDPYMCGSNNPRYNLR